MGASSYIFAMAFANQKVESWTTGGTKAFEYMGAVPMCVVPDNPKPVVTKTSMSMATNNYPDMDKIWDSVRPPMWDSERPCIIPRH